MDEIAGAQRHSGTAKRDQLPAIQALPFVAAATPDAVRNARPVDVVAATNFTNGFSTWDQDAINVTNRIGNPTPPPTTTFNGRTEPFNGSGVYVAILDTGLLPTWRQYFPQERIATEFANAFGGGGQDNGNVPSSPNKWEDDVNSHGTHVTSTVLGYRSWELRSTVPPRWRNVIPVKVLNQNGSGWSSTIARGILYIRDLKLGALANSPVVINMSLGGPELDAVEKAAIDAAVQAGVIIVASAGNSGPTGVMGFPGAYGPVISVASAGIRAGVGGQQFLVEQRSIQHHRSYRPGAILHQRLLGAPHRDSGSGRGGPGSWTVGPYQVNQSNRASFFFLGGTSMASPHVAGIVALMLQKNPRSVWPRLIGPPRLRPFSRARQSRSLTSTSKYVRDRVRPWPRRPAGTRIAAVVVW